MARISKPNIMDSPHLSHSKSNGLYYGFGKRGRFKIVNNSSVGLYVNKKSCNAGMQEEIDDSASFIEKMISVELKNSINTFSSIVPNVKMLISPVLDVAYDLQEKYGDIGMKVTSTGRGCWSSNLCVNATTGLFHNEEDCTYTIICVPLQVKSRNQ